MNPRAALRMRLAERLGLTDPTDLDGLTEEEWTQWHALSLVDDWGHDRIADLCAAIHNSLMMAAAKQGGSVGKDDLRKPEDFRRTFAWERNPKVQTADQQFAVLTNQLGMTNANRNSGVQDRR
jgi:hypothetical protein